MLGRDKQGNLGVISLTFERKLGRPIGVEFIEHSAKEKSFGQKRIDQCIHVRKLTDRRKNHQKGLVGTVPGSYTGLGRMVVAMSQGSKLHNYWV
jgi:hypothetical protein